MTIRLHMDTVYDMCAQCVNLMDVNVYDTTYWQV